MRSLHSTGTLGAHSFAGALAAAALVSVGLLTPRGAAACVLEPVRLHRSDASLAQSDTAAPDTPIVAAALAYRRSGLTCGEDICVANNCGDMGGIAVDLDAADDQTPTRRLGYRLQLVSGTVPAALRNMLGVDLEGPTPLRVHLAFDDVPSVDAILRVVAIDAAGNESLPSEPFALAFDGCTLAATGDQCENDYDADAEFAGSGTRDADAEFAASGGTVVVAGNGSTEEQTVSAAALPALEAPAWSSEGQGCSLPAGAPRGSLLGLLAPAVLGWAAARRRR